MISFPTPKDGSSLRYGTTVLGGSENCGVVFQLSLDSGKWREEVIHSFDGRATLNDGCTPNSVFEDSDGNIIGTTSNGSPESTSAGPVFNLVPNKAHTKWTEHVLAGFVCTGRTGMSVPTAQNRGATPLRSMAVSMARPSPEPRVQASHANRSQTAA